MGKVLPFAATPDAEEEARQWIVRIDRGPLDPAERAALHAWLARDPRHGELLDSCAKLWQAAGKAARAGQAGSGSTPRAPGRQRSRAAWGAGAALAAGLAALVFWFGQSGHPAETARLLQTAAGQHQTYAMSDGSQVELNTRSQVRVAYQPGQRRIALLAGEGLFEVAKDRHRPFIVSAGATEVRAVGTRFTVRRLADGQVQVIVHEGVVSVTASEGAAEPARSVTLAAGQALDTRKGGFAVSRVDAARLARLLAWRQDRVAFDDTPLPAALEEISRYAPLPIRIGDARLAGLKVSGSFSTRDVEGFVRTLEQAFQLKVERGADAYVVLPARKG